MKMPVPARKSFGLKWPCFWTGNRAGFGQKVFVPDENLKHIISTACRPGVFQIALSKYTPYTPPLPYRTLSGHKSGNNGNDPRKTLRVGINVADPERYIRAVTFERFSPSQLPSGG